MIRHDFEILIDSRTETMHKIGDVVKSLHTRANKYGGIYAGEHYWVDGIETKHGMECLRFDGAGTAFWPSNLFFKVDMKYFDSVILTEEGFDIIDFTEKM